MSEPRVETVKEWTHAGVNCRLNWVSLHPSMAHWTGYAQLPDDVHMDRGTAEVELRVHGGITYGPDEERWVGFDTGHAFDVPVRGDIEFGLFETSEEASKWTQELVEQEIESLAAQLAERSQTAVTETSE